MVEIGSLLPRSKNIGAIATSAHKVPTVNPLTSNNTFSATTIVRKSRCV